MADWRDVALAKGVDQNNPAALAAAGIVPNGSNTPQSSSSLGNSDSYINAAIKKMQEANKPIIESQQKAIPETQQRYSTQRENIKSRYSNLISSIKGNQQVAETRQTTATNNELGRRGIVSSSGVAEQEMTNALNPITQQYTGYLNEANTAQGEEESTSVANETNALREIQNAIAQLQSGANTQGIQLGTNLFQTDQQTRANEIAQQLQRDQLAEQQKQAAADQAYREKQLAEQQRQFNVSQKSNSSGDLSSLFNVLGIGTQQTQSKPAGKYIPEIGKSVIGYDSQGRAIYSDGSRGYTYGIKK